MDTISLTHLSTLYLSITHCRPNRPIAFLSSSELSNRIAAQIAGTRIGRIRLRRVPDASAKSLEDAIGEGVEPGSAIRTDGWKEYNCLNRIGYIHDVIREEADVGDSLLPRCHRVASLLKRWMMGTHQGAISHEHLYYYLDEYTFRFNRRTSRYVASSSID